MVVVGQSDWGADSDIRRVFKNISNDMSVCLSSLLFFSKIFVNVLQTTYITRSHCDIGDTILKHCKISPNLL